VIASLGRFWTHRIITIPGAPIARTGPYRYVAHPNYAVTLIETFVLPLAFGALALAVIMTALWWVCWQPRSGWRTRRFYPGAEFRARSAARGACERAGLRHRRSRGLSRFC
jgi:protein-S-isoprenylcysteine O-methyltransferase Ste14